MKCVNCMFWYADRIPPGTETSDVQRRYCRRYPPEVHITPPARDGDRKVANFYWPVVAADDWCGEYKAQPRVTKPTVVSQKPN